MSVEVLESLSSNMEVKLYRNKGKDLIFSGKTNKAAVELMGDLNEI